MQEEHILEKAFEDFSSIEESMDLVKAEVKRMLDEDINLHVGELTKIVTKLSAQGGGEERLNAISEASEYMITHLMEQKLDHCTTLFFPSKNNEKRLMKYLKFADDYCYCAIYTITNDKLSRVLYTLKDRGVDVRVITDDETVQNMGSDIHKLANAGIQVRVDPDPQARMHHKFVVLDDEILINGSFNWTSSAVHKNFENVVILDQPKLIKDFKTVSAIVPKY